MRGEGGLGLFWATKIGGPSHGFDYEGQCLLPLLANARQKAILVDDPAYPAHAASRTHLRFLWTARGLPVLWLEATLLDFGARVDQTTHRKATLERAVAKAAAMDVMLSVDPADRRLLKAIVGAVADRRDRLVLRPSNGVVEASDYLTPKHDWYQADEEVTAAFPRIVYHPAPDL